MRLVTIFGTLTIGWPLYLFTNASGRKYERFANHFDPYSPIFSKRERLEIAISDAALIAVVGGLTGLAQSFGWLWLLKVCLLQDLGSWPVCAMQMPTELAFQGVPSKTKNLVCFDG